jgi:cell division transport system ATP-binding protein
MEGIKKDKIIELRGVYKFYGHNFAALWNINLNVYQREFVYITGPSGSGKTTLLKLLCRAERPDLGKILIYGRDITLLQDSSLPYLRRNIGIIFQDFKLLRDRNVFYNVAFILEAMGMPPRVIQRRVSEALERVRLSKKSTQMPHRLSGGEMQRVAIARAIVTNPSILLADEPTCNLDPILTSEMMDLFEEMNKKGTTIILATHHYVLLPVRPDRMIELSEGRLVFSIQEKNRDQPQVA